MKKTRAILLPIALAASMAACDNNDPVDLSAVEPEILQYVEQFQTEATARNRSIEVDGLQISFVPEIERDGETHCGYAYTGLRIEISKERNCWLTRNQTDREVLIFHELGHALLMREHTDILLMNGEWKSLMNTGSLRDLYPARSVLSVTDYDEQRRTYYLDELFNPTTPAPAWSVPSQNRSGQ